MSGASKHFGQYRHISSLEVNGPPCICAECEFHDITTRLALLTERTKRRWFLLGQMADALNDGHCALVKRIRLLMKEENIVLPDRLWQNAVADNCYLCYSRLHPSCDYDHLRDLIVIGNGKIVSCVWLSMPTIDRKHIHFLDKRRAATLIHIAILHNHVWLLQLLIRLGFTITKPLPDKWSYPGRPGYYIEENHPECFEVLQEAKML